MKIQGHVNSLETNVQAETQEFGIGNASKIIAILRDKLYENKKQTLVQEYICNARDAMREAGKDNKFEITVPTKLNPVFKVRDFGLGITPDRMSNVFIMYGSSTKTDSNTQTGGFGIGAKSAWSYTDSFTIVSVTDRLKRTYVAHLGANKNGRLDLISTDPTEEPNGTEIQVAVQPYDVDEFRTAIFRAICFWKDQPKLKGELHPPTLVQGEVVSDLLETADRDLLPEYIQWSNYSDQSLAVIDGIPYPITGKLTSRVPSLIKLGKILKKEVILHFGNGVVEVGANRESISDSDFTIKALEKLSKKALLEVQTKISDAFAKVTNNKEYIQTYGVMSKHYDVDGYAKFGGYSIEGGELKSTLLKKVKMTSIHCLNRRGHQIKKVTKEELSEAKKMIDIDALDAVYFETKQETKIQQNKRVRAYLETAKSMVLIEPLLVLEFKDDKDDKGNVVKVESKRYLDMKSFNEVVADLSAKDFQSITYVEVPKVAKVRTKREDAALCLHTAHFGARHQYTTLAKNTQQWLYVEMSGGSYGKVAGFHVDKSSLLDLECYLEKDTDYKVCALSAKAVSQVQNDPNFTPLTEWLKKWTPTKEAIAHVKSHWAKQRDAVALLKSLKGIEDPFLLDAVSEYDNLTNKLATMPEILRNKTAEVKEVKEFIAMESKLQLVLETKYPLIGVYEEYYHKNHKNEFAIYINAKFSNKKGKK